MKNKLFICSDIVVMGDNIIAVLESGELKIGAIANDGIDKYSAMDYFKSHQTKETWYRNLPSELQTIEYPKVGFGIFSKFTSRENIEKLEKYCLDIESIINNYESKKEADRIALREKERVSYQARQEKEKRDLITRFGTEYGLKIYNRQVAIGMSKEICKEAWGQPDNSQVNNNEWEAWYYVSTLSGSISRIIFNKGKVVEIFK